MTAPPSTPGDDTPDRGLSAGQSRVLDVVAKLQPGGVDDGYSPHGEAPPGTAGYYLVGDIIFVLGDPGDRRAGARLRKALSRLERRGLIKRHGRDPGRWASLHLYFTLTGDGVAAVNHRRRRWGLAGLAGPRREPAPPAAGADPSV